MGLLGDVFGADEDQRDALRRAMLMAAAQARGNSRGEAFQNALMGGLMGYDQSKELKLKRQMEQMKLEQQQMQLGQLRRQDAAQQGLSDAFKASTKPAVPYMGGMTGSMDQQDIPQGRPESFDNQAFVSAAGPHALTLGGPQGLAQLQTMYAKTDPFAKQREKVDLKDYTPDSVRAYLATGSTGQPPDLTKLVPRDKIIADDNGLMRTYRTEFSLSPLAQVQRGVDPNTQFTGGITMRGQNMTDSRAREAQAQAERHFQTNQGKPGFHMIGPDPFMVNPNGTATPVRDLGTGQPIAGDKKLTESEAKNSIYLAQMVAASDALRGIEQKGFDPNSTIRQLETNRVNSGGVTGAISNVFASSQSQQAAQAQMQWAEAFLRVKTGAAANANEIVNNVRTFFPQVGDSPAVVAQKNEARAEVERDMLMGVGASKKQLEPRTQPKQVIKPSAGRVMTPEEKRKRLAEWGFE